MSGIAIVGFGPGTVVEEPVGVLCSGCHQPVASGQRGYLLSGEGSSMEAWHRACSLERRSPAPMAAPAAPAAWEAVLTGHSAIERALVGTTGVRT